MVYLTTNRGSHCLFDNESWQVEVEEFLMGCLRLRGPATAMDMGKVLRDQNWMVQTLGILGGMNHTLWDWEGMVARITKCFGLDQSGPQTSEFMSRMLFSYGFVGSVQAASVPMSRANCVR